MRHTRHAAKDRKKMTSSNETSGTSKKTARRERDLAPSWLPEGQVVYSVIQHMPYEGDDDTWKIENRRIVTSTPLKVRLDRPFHGSASTHGLVSKAYLGRLFHRTPTEALTSFREVQLRNIGHHERMRAEAQRALDWCNEAQRELASAAELTRNETPAAMHDIFIVLGARDDSDFDRSTTEYVVCYFLDEEEAREFAQKATALAAELEPRARRVDAEELKELKARNRLDPNWSLGNEGPTRYHVELATLGTGPT